MEKKKITEIKRFFEKYKNFVKKIKANYGNPDKARAVI